MDQRSDKSQRTRKRIIESARLLFSRQGFDAVSIDDVMAHAGLTRGGFYRHFSTKADLYAEALGIAVQSPPDARGTGPDCTDSDIARRLIRTYLSQHHLEDVDPACPVVPVPSGVARSDPTVRRVFQEAFYEVTNVFVRSFESRPADGATLDRALAMAALCVGGLAVARAIDDEELATSIRSAALTHAMELGGLTKGQHMPRLMPRSAGRGSRRHERKPSWKRCR
jgi:AcrR family transcriptional regulator